MRTLFLGSFGCLGLVVLACSAPPATPTSADAVVPVADVNAMGAATPAPLAVARPDMPMLAGQAIYRPECFGYAEDEVRQNHQLGFNGPTTGRGYGGASSSSSTRSASQPKSAPMPSAPPPPPMKTARTVTPAAPEAAEAAPLDDAAGASDGLAMGEATADKKAKDDDLRSSTEEVTGQKAAYDNESQPSLDWGATVWLSNDDSMSLASAQRVIFAAQQGMVVPTSQIRPHELLNYFSFDTKAPAAGETFGVLAAARQDGDQLHLALAVKGATPAPEPLDLTLVIDRSGSMSSEGRMDYTRRGLHQMEGSLAKGDRVDLVLFDDQVCTPLENYVVGRDDPALLSKVIDQLQPRGSTDLDLGMKEGFRVAKTHESTAQGRNRRMMLITDAELNTGNVDPGTVTDIAKAYEESGIRLTGVGVGRDFNDKILDMLTEKGKGAYVYLGSEAVVDRVFGQSGFPSLTQTIAHDVHFAIDLPDSLGLEKFYGEEASTTKEDVQPINYYAGTGQLFLQDLRVKDGKLHDADEVAFEAEWTDAQTGEPHKRTWQTTVGALLESDPHNVDKGLALMAWSDVLTADAMGGDACGAPLSKYGDRAGKVLDDAEIAFVNGLVQKRCPAFQPRSTLTASTAGRVSFKVKVDSDIPIAEVALACAGQRWTDAISAADSVARFDATPGSCTVTLSGTVDMAASVDVPTTGGDARCVVRGGRVSCG